MRQFTINILILLSLTAGNIKAVSDTTKLFYIGGRLEKFYRANPVEKLYIHRDRSLYHSGETMWLKVYQTLQPASAEGSKVVYLDFLDEDGQVVISNRWPLNKGIAYGGLDLPERLNGGVYWLRVYTRYMQNYSADALCMHRIDIVGYDNEKLPSKKEKRKKKEEIRISFYPEGGEMVETLPSKIAFKVTNHLGKGIPAKGIIKNKAGSVVQSFETAHLGQGAFYLIPEPGEEYTAYLDNTGISSVLPPAKKEGIVMGVKPRTDNLRITLNQKLKPESKQKELYLLLHQNGKIASCISVHFKSGWFVADVPAEKLPEGIFTVTLFDTDYRIYAERAAVIRMPEPLPVSIQSECRNSSVCSKVSLQIRIGEDTGRENNQGDFSLSVADSVLDNLSVRDNYYTSHFFSSELRGKVEKPLSYFGAGKVKLAQADLLLLIQGWRRYSWKDILCDDASGLVYPMEKGITVTGRVAPFTRKMNEEGIHLHVIFRQDTIRKNFLYPIGKDGMFRISDLDFEGPGGLLLFANDKKNRPLRVSVDSLPLPSSANIPFYENEDESENSQIVSYRAKGKKFPRGELDKQIFELGEVEVTAKKKEKERDRMYNVNFIHGAFDLDPNKSYGGTVIQLLNHLPGIRVMPSFTSPGKQVARIIGVTESAPPVLVVDGFVARDPDLVYDMPSDLIERVEILKGPDAVIYNAFGASGGAIVFFTRKGGVEKEKSEYVSVCNLLGYNQHKESYVPECNQEQPAADYPRTIFWRPAVTAGADGKIDIVFETRKKGVFLINFEGRTKKGKIVSGSSILRIAE